MRAAILAFVLLVALVLGLVLHARSPSLPLAAAAADSGAGHRGEPLAAATAGDDALHARRPVREPAPPTATAGEPLTFEDYLRRTIALAQQAHDAGAAGRTSEVDQLDARARQLWERLWHDVDDPARDALIEVSQLMSEDVTMATRIRRNLCARVLAEGLDRRYRGAQHESRLQGDLDAMVAAVLAALPRDETLATLLAPLLVDRPYLGLPHEEAVLDLVSESAERLFLRPPAVSLLLTLWHNLEAQGARTSQDLVALALIFKDDANPARRLAALRHLLTAADGRLREVVLQDVLDHHDREAARELGIAAANELPPKDALDVLTRLAPLDAKALTGAFMLVAEHDPTAVRQAYDEQLATGTRAALRAELISAAGFVDDPAAMDTVRYAFDHDPDPSVRTQAMFALTAKTGAALGESTLMAALDDRTLSGSSLGLGAIALALENLATGDPNVVDRVGHRLLARQDLPDESRARVEQLLDRVLPGH